jgi:1,4-dihydroxy-6-naphthoate synthase
MITLGHSPDPDDAFMFYAMAKNLIDLRGYEFEHILQDIQTLNERATRGELHVSAISIHAYSYVLDKYALMPCGASMGENYGPMLVAPDTAGLPENPEAGQVREWLKGKTVAIPGKMTSAYLAFQLAVGTDLKTRVVPFDEIFADIKAGNSDVGLIIHEGQLTYGHENLHLVLDLGVWWMRRTGLPLPLGGNVIRKDFGLADRKAITEIVRESVAYALTHRRPAVEHSMSHARGLDTDLADRFIGMYVNALTLDYGDRGREGIRRFLREAHEARIIPAPVELEFVEL